MKCSFSKEDIISYAEGGVSLERAAKIKEHLAACGKCRKLLGVIKLSESFASHEADPDKDFYLKAVGAVDPKRYKKHKMKYGFSAFVSRLAPAVRPVAAVVIICVLALAAGLNREWLGSLLPRNIDKVPVESTATPAPAATPTPDNSGFNTYSYLPSGFNSLHMVSKTGGWALFDTGVVRTADGGASWLDVTPEALAGKQAGKTNEMSYTRIFSLDESTAWVSSSEYSGDKAAVQVFRTSDGGRHWEASALPVTEAWEGEAGAEPFFINPERGWILALSSIGAGNRTESVYTTGDGGKSWERVALQPTVKTQDGERGLGKVWGIAFRNETDGWVSLDYPGPFIPIYKTPDGGKTWTWQSLEYPAGYTWDNVGNVAVSLPVFSGSDNLDGVLPVEFWKESRVLATYTTHDGGKTWTLAGLLEDYSKARFIDAQHGWAIDSKGTKFYYTGDGGATWKETIPNIRPGNDDGQMADFDFSNNAAWLYFGGTLYRSEDSGATWTPVSQEKK